MNVIKNAELLFRPTAPLAKVGGDAAQNDFGAYLKDALGEVKIGRASCRERV